MEIDATQVLDAFRRDYPREYEITVLRLVNAAQAKKIAELLSADPDPEVARDDGAA